MYEKENQNEVNPSSPLKESYEEEMKRAAQDPLFLADIAEIMEDFKYVDSEWTDELLNDDML